MPSECHAWTEDFPPFEAPVSSRIYDFSGIATPDNIGDAGAVVLMRICRSAMPAHGRLLIIQRFVTDGTPRTDLWHAPALPAGRLRTLERSQALLRKDGFHAIRFVALDATLGLLGACTGEMP